LSTDFWNGLNGLAVSGFLERIGCQRILGNGLNGLGSSLADALAVSFRVTPPIVGGNIMQMLKGVLFCGCAGGAGRLRGRANPFNPLLKSVGRVCGALDLIG